MASRFIPLIPLSFVLTAANFSQVQSDDAPDTILLVAVLLLTAAVLRLAHPSRKKHLR